MTLIRASFLLGPLALAACGPADNEPGPGGVTVGEARALDEAAAMLDERKAMPAAMPENGAEAENVEGDEESALTPAEAAETR